MGYSIVVYAIVVYALYSIVVYTAMRSAVLPASTPSLALRRQLPTTAPGRLSPKHSGDCRLCAWGLRIGLPGAQPDAGSHRFRPRDPRYRSPMPSLDDNP